ncbi:hypothetical protein LHK12_10495 [Providencia rettgeri]|nr:hypothetical protein [Providencia rettgeri]
MDVLISANEPLFNNHNLFIAQGDELEVFHKNIQAHSKEQVIFGIYNHQDGLAYSLIGKGLLKNEVFISGCGGHLLTFNVLCLYGRRVINF